MTLLNYYPSILIKNLRNVRFFTFIVMSVSLVLAFQAKPLFALKKGDKAPPIILESNNGKIFNLRRHVKKMKQGNLTAFAFFSVTCKPCVKELKDLQQIYGKSKGSGFHVYMICVDLLKKTPKSKIKAFLNKIGVDMPLLYDAYRRAGKSYGIVNNGAALLPGLFVIDSQRKIIIISKKYSKKTIRKLAKMVQ